MNDEPSPSASTAPRLPNGQFGKGNEFGKGNKVLAKMHALRVALLESVDDEAMGRVTKKLVSLAESGDLEAIKILFSYVIGKPDSVIRLTGEDGGPVMMGSVTLQQSAQEITAWRKQMTAELLSLVSPDEMDGAP